MKRILTSLLLAVYILTSLVIFPAKAAGGVAVYSGNQQIAGYTDFPAKIKPFSKDRKTLYLRRDQEMQVVTVDTPYAVECKPAINGKNKMDYVEVLTRRFYTDHFVERTVIRLDQLTK